MFARQNHTRLQSKLMMMMLGFVACMGVFAILSASMPVAHAENGTAICSAQADPTNNIGTCINRIYVISLAVGGILAVLVFVVAGYYYMSGGNGVGTAMTMIKSAITGLIILFSTFLFLNTINPDLTSFTGLSLPNVTCGTNNSLCAAPTSNFLGSVGGTSGGTSNPITITGAVSSDKNVQLTATLNGQSSPSGYTWAWTSNGQALTDQNGNPVSTSSIDTTMDSNSTGSHTDVVVATATAPGNPPSTFTGTSTFTIVFDANGDATSVTTVSTGLAGSGSCSVSTSAYASPSTLQPIFGTNAAAASEIAQAESSGNPGATGDMCELSNNPASIGLFQINLSANALSSSVTGGASLNCPSAFSAGGAGSSTLDTSNGKYKCSVTNMNLYNQCVSAMQNPTMNAQEAYILSKSGTNWGPWSTHTKCGL